MAQNTNDPQGNQVEYSGKPGRVQYGEHRCCLELSDAVPEPVAAAGAAGDGTQASRDNHIHAGLLELSDENPLEDGIADPGTGTRASREDHIHPLPEGLISAWGDMLFNWVYGNPGSAAAVPVIDNVYQPFINFLPGLNDPGNGVTFLNDDVNGDYLRSNLAGLNDFLVSFHSSFVAIGDTGGWYQWAAFVNALESDLRATDISGVPSSPEPFAPTTLAASGVLSLALNDEVRLKMIGARFNPEGQAAVSVTNARVAIHYLGPTQIIV